MVLLAMTRLIGSDQRRALTAWSLRRGIPLAALALIAVQLALLVVPLLDLPQRDTSLELDQDARFAPDAHWSAGSPRIVFGVPCLFTPGLGDCKAQQSHNNRAPQTQSSPHG